MPRLYKCDLAVFTRMIGAAFRPIPFTLGGLVSL